MKEKKNYDSFIFTHIPKCGGTSFRKLINDSAAESGISSDKVYIPGFNGLANDKNINQLTDEEILSFKNSQFRVIAAHSKFNLHKELELKLASPYYYTILRHPIKRFISHYHFFYFTLGYNKLKGVNLNELDKDKLIFLIKKLSNIQTDYLANFKFKKVLGDENLLKLAKFNLKYEYDSYGILENMNDSIEEFKISAPEWLEINSDISLLNSSNSKKHHITEDTIDLIKKYNELDLELYRFALANSNVKLKELV